MYFILFLFLGRTGEKQIQQMSAKTCPITKECSGGRVHGDMYEEAEVKKEKTRGRSFKFVFPSFHCQKQNLSMNWLVYS